MYSIAYKVYPYPYWVNTPWYNFSNEFTDQYIPFTDEMDYNLRFDIWQSGKDDSLIELKENL